MRYILLFIAFVIGDIYFFQAFHTIFQSTLLLGIYWSIDIAFILGVVILLYLWRSGHALQKIAPTLITCFLVIFVPKIATFPILFAEDIFRAFLGFPNRSVYVSETVLCIAILILGLIIFGLTKGRHFYRVRKEILNFPDLPDAFDGFQITQISDIHSGSFTSSDGVIKGIELANAQQSDLVLFTGDLVNYQASEMEPWISSFKTLYAPYGKFSVLGNHDYGDYMRWASSELKISNLRRLKNIHKEMGFKLMTNESITISKNGDSISLIGVENWGKGGFQQYGDLTQATSDLSNDSFNILMSHDPSHWEHVTLAHHKHIHLTLSGHTHGLQFGVELFGFKWSPVQYFYRQWAGLYQRDGKYLYVNRGFGYHGLKGRIGVWPEITVIILRKSAVL